MTLLTQLLVAMALTMVSADNLDRLPFASVGDRLPPGWQVRPVRGVGRPTTVVVEEGATRAIRFEATREAAWHWVELESEREASGGMLAWRWRVDDAVDGANLLDARADDSPARVFVVFGRPGLLSRPRAIFYTWGRTEPQLAMWRMRGDPWAVIVLRNESDAQGSWLEEIRDPAADYRAAFGSEPGRITAVGFMIDTDATGERAVSLLGELTWLPGPVHEDRGSMSALTTRPVATASSASSASFKP